MISNVIRYNTVFYELVGYYICSGYMGGLKTITPPYG